MEILKNIKKWILQWIWILLVLIFSWATYAAWISLSQEVDGQPLTAAKWNAVIDRLNSIDQKQLATAWVNFDWTNCPSNVCLLKSSYNISSVVKQSVGVYKIYFVNPLLDINYIIGWSVVWTTGLYYHSLIASTWIANTTSYFEIKTLNVNGTAYDLNNVSLQVFWWK